MAEANLAKRKEPLLIRLIVFVSVAIPALIAIMFKVAPPQIDHNYDLSILPMFHAGINFTVSLLLLSSWYFIKNKNISAHKACNVLALVLSSLFLVSYVIYHSLTEPTSFGGEGILKGIYYFVLISHIVLSAIILPIVLFTFLRAFTGETERHKKIARWTMPIWLYVSITGVLVYLLISPYY